MSDLQDAQRELLRQQQLLRALWQPGAEASLAPWLRERGERAQQGLSAYRGNAAAIAERTLAAAHPTVQQLLGDESFGQLARLHWHRAPPRCGDLARYGETLADWIADDPQLASEPYLADVARVDWAVHAIERAADVADARPGLALLGERDPSQLRLVLRPQLAIVVSHHPVVTIWHAHRRSEADRFASVRRAFADGVAETALVARPQWRATVSAIDDDSARFFDALQRGGSLAQALDAAGTAFEFERWLHEAVRQRWLQGVEGVACPAAGPMR